VEERRRPTGDEALAPAQEIVRGKSRSTLPVASTKALKYLII